MKRIIVTGGSGKAGRAVVRDLLDHGFDVLNVDLAAPAERISDYLKADLTDLGQAYEAVRGADALVHLAAIPAPGLLPAGETFRINTTSTYNVFQASVELGISRVVWASSETTLGLPFDRVTPLYAPIDEEHPLFPESSYALSKVVGEQMAAQFSRWSGIPFISLRFSNVMEPHDYARFPTWQHDPHARKWNLWGYIDARDAAQSCRLSLQADLSGAQAFIIANADTCMSRPNAELLAEAFPTVPLRQGTGDHDTLLSIDKARRLLGYDPQHSWRRYASV